MELALWQVAGGTPAGWGRIGRGSLEPWHGSGGRDVSKQEIREKIWDYIGAQNIDDFPMPVHHRIPNFKGSYEACQNIRELEVYSRMQEVKVDPDKPLEVVRLIVLQARKTLLVPPPLLRTGLFNKIVPPPGATKEILRKCATSQGVKNYSVAIGLDSKVLMDFIVVGSVAVSEKRWRIGKEEGYADMEYAMMVSLGAIREETPVITFVHDCQVIDIPEDLIGAHDLTVDYYILTPTRVIVMDCQRQSTKGIIWSMISEEIMERILILKNLHFCEKQAGKDLTLQKTHPVHLKNSQTQAGHKWILKKITTTKPFTYTCLLNTSYFLSNSMFLKKQVEFWLYFLNRSTFAIDLGQKVKISI
ncbi:LOW QUALITY PROTEIN: methenyltetrahydrofolate synthase domain-containing protein-like [Sminthopsis crassicaudata]|uniref:LOW QUALITY PROTEIN: methenyltetrahydrofolate synthase domain-containing protein-like n=1 Tax=Sminthopsis crassicaudata TaxID=9301 RepID=UPI003D697161